MTPAKRISLALPIITGWAKDGDEVCMVSIFEIQQVCEILTNDEETIRQTQGTA